MRPGLTTIGTIIVALCGLGLPAAYGATSEQTLARADFEQRIGATLPQHIRLRDTSGGDVALGELAGDRPLILVMSWFDCPNLCPMVLEQLARATGELPFDSDDYQVAAISIDPVETPADARAQQQRLVQGYGQRPQRWRFLTGNREAIVGVAKAVGFHYAYDAERDRFAHPAGYVVVAPGGVVSRYLFTLRPSQPDLRLALLEAGRGQLGSPLDQVVLRCYRFSPDSGQYNLAVVRLLQAAGGTFLMVSILAFWWMRRRQRGR